MLQNLSRSIEILKRSQIKNQEVWGRTHFDGIPKEAGPNIPKEAGPTEWKTNNCEQCDWQPIRVTKTVESRVVVPRRERQMDFCLTTDKKQLPLELATL